LLALLDVALVLLIGIFLIVLSVTVLVRLFRGKPTGYDQLSALPESWRRWVLDEKPKKK
jgi:hypothetical protein